MKTFIINLCMAFVRFGGPKRGGSPPVPCVRKLFSLYASNCVIQCHFYWNQFLAIPELKFCTEQLKKRQLFVVLFFTNRVFFNFFKYSDSSSRVPENALTILDHSQEGNFPLILYFSTACYFSNERFFGSTDFRRTTHF
jgi:hypothetical protein